MLDKMMLDKMMLDKMSSVFPFVNTYLSLSIEGLIRLLIKKLYSQNGPFDHR
jgi:hypothetical protein